MRTYRGHKIAMIFQEPMTSLNPVFTCGEQVMEAILLHQKVNRQQAETRRSELAYNALKGQWEADQAKWAQEDQAAKERRQEEHDNAQAEAINRAVEAPIQPAPKSGSGTKAKDKKSGKKIAVSKARKA